MIQNIQKYTRYIRKYINMSTEISMLINKNTSTENITYFQRGKVQCEKHKSIRNMVNKVKRFNLGLIKVQGQLTEGS